MGTRLRFNTETRESVRPRRDHHASHYFEWDRQILVFRYVVELEPISGFHAHVHWGKEVLPRFGDSGSIDHAGKLVFEELLPDPTQKACLSGTRLKSAIILALARAWPRQETQCRLKR